MSKIASPAPQDSPAAAPAGAGLIDPALLAHLRKTVAAVTRPWWQGEVVSANGLIFGVNLGGSRPPLVWCFQGYAEFAALAAALGPDQPLYGLRSGHLVVKPGAKTHLHMAMICAEELLSLGLSGPMFLGGNCQGALLAQKIAQILTAADHPVALLICLNPFLITPYGGRAAFILGRHDITNPLHRFHDAEALLRERLPLCSLDTIPSEHGSLFSGKILDLWSAILRRRIEAVAGTSPGAGPLWSLCAELAAPAQLVMPARGLCEVPVTLRNSTDQLWAPSRESGLTLGNHWRAPDGSLLQWLDGQQPFTQPLPPGGTFETTLLVRPPEREGEYLLEIDLQQAGVLWLSELGSAPTTCRVTVLPPVGGAAG